MNEVENNELINNEQVEKPFYSPFSLAALGLTLTKLFMVFINLLLDTDLSLKYPLLAGSLVLSVIGRQKYHDKLSKIMMIVNIVLIVFEVIIIIILFLILIILVYDKTKK